MSMCSYARDAGTFLRDARDLLAGHFERCPYMRDAQDFLTGRILTCPCVDSNSTIAFKCGHYERDLLANHPYSDRKFGMLQLSQS